MTKRMLIDDTQPEETRVVIVDGNKVEDVEFESTSRKQIKGNIYLAKVIRIEPSLQAAFVDYGGNRHGFLAFNEIHPDYYNVPENIMKEVDAEVDEIIEGKIRYLKERDAERARYKAEKEALEASRRLEAEQAHEVEEAQLEPAQDVLPENDEYLHTDNAAALSEETTADTKPSTDKAKTEKKKKNVEPTEAPEVPVFRPHTETAIILPQDAAMVEPTVIAAEENSAETPTENKSRRRRRASRRPRDRKKAPQTMAEAAGLESETLEDEIDEDLDSDDDIEESEGNEYNFDLQRKLLKARKLFHRSTIQDVIKEGQILLIQIVKEERGNKGAACTTYISLAGRYCVLMPNRVKSGGVSRKITNANDRKRLKAVMKKLPLNSDMSLIIRTAGEDKTDADIIRDYNYLIRTWNAIRYGALRTSAPAIIYEEGNLIKRALRDMYTKDISEVIIDGDEAYQTARNFVKILSPHNLKHIRNRKPGDVPVFQRFQIEAQLDKLHNPVVQLESGGYLVINPTEALVSIDVNSGRATKERDIEETALKTNLEAADEIAKQLKMRDLAGLIVVDFIDMYEAQNNAAVEKRMKEAMKDDRARIQIAKMSIFGLLEISRQRMHSSFMESNYEPCPYCHGRGVTRTVESGATLILRSIEGEGVRNRGVKLTVSVPVEFAAYLLNHKRKQLSALEETYDLQIIISGDSTMKDISDYNIAREKLQQISVTKDATTTCYEAENMEYDEDEEEAEDYEAQGEENGDRRFRFRRNNRGRRTRRDNGAERRNQERSNERKPENIANDTKTEKKSWWQRLLG
ncbi:MAG: Rne/Rng family ribonuclease [Alphaproteobacteria bacterium]|nr:Rne/Rng family ribonuclease [Alphaproteobacteria bacterium]